MNTFTTEISSVPDREKLVAEIWYENELIAEINQENHKLVIEFYTHAKNSFDYQELIKALKIAKKKLLYE